MKNKFYTIQFISALSLIVFAIASIIFIVLFAFEYTKMQKGLIESKFENIIFVNAEQIDKEVICAKENLQRLKGYISVLDMTDSSDALKYLNRVMAENIQFQPNEYNCYFAFEAPLAKKYFNKKAFIYTVNKNFELKNTDEYNNPRNFVVSSWIDPKYLTDSSEIWYHIAKKSLNFEITPIYFDSSYMKVWMFTVALGIYDKNKFNGMVGIDILLDGILKDVEKIKIGKTGGVIIVDNKSGLVLTKNEGPGKSEFLEIRERFKKNVFESTSQSDWVSVVKNNLNGINIKNNNKDFVVSSRKCSQMPWTIIAYQDSDELGAELTKSIFSFSLAGILLLCLLGAISYLFNKNLSFPIKNLINSMKKVKDANVEGIMAPVEGTVETKFLGEIFNKMILTIGSAIKEKELFYTKLEEANRTLEGRVDERTRELVGKNSELQTTLEKLKDTQEQLIVKEKLASLGSLTAGIAHEIKNPLNFINNFSQLSIEIAGELSQNINTQNISEDKKVEIDELLADLRQNSEKINQHGKRADSIVKNMLLHSRGKSGEKQKVDFNAISEEYLNLAYHGMRAVDSNFNVNIEKDFDPNLGLVSLVPQDFGRALLNIINNSFYAVMEKKKKHLKDPYTPCVFIKTQKMDGKISIIIRDNGTGIPKDVIDKIYNPFFTTKPPGSGTGLGLSMAHEIIVREHKGEIKLNSQLDSFTEFIIEIPEG